MIKTITNGKNGAGKLNPSPKKNNFKNRVSTNQQCAILSTVQQQDKLASMESMIRLIMIFS